jgi:hypothetical protein
MFTSLTVPRHASVVPKLLTHSLTYILCADLMSFCAVLSNIRTVFIQNVLFKGATEACLGTVRLVNGAERHQISAEDICERMSEQLRKNRYTGFQQLHIFDVFLRRAQQHSDSFHPECPFQRCHGGMPGYSKAQKDIKSAQRIYVRE